MQYDILYINDDGSVKVRMTIDDSILEQDFPATDDPLLLDLNIREAMRVFKKEIANRPKIDEPDIQPLVGQSFQVSDDFSSSQPIQSPPPDPPIILPGN